MRRQGKKPLEEGVRAFLEEHGFAHIREPLVAAVSGGPDSLCLLHLLYRLKDSLGLNLHVAHLNHGLRGAEGEEDAQFVARLAQDLGLPVTLGREDVKSYRATRRCSLEEAARELRYTFLHRVVEDTGARGAVVAHTADDQAETVLMHLIRGTGLTGLGGMRTVTSLTLPSRQVLTVIRPLLGASREETEGYCRDHGLGFRVDSSNLSIKYLRNRIRWELLPALKRYNPNIRDALLRLARAAQDDLAYLDSQIYRVWEDVASEGPYGLALNLEATRALTPALQRHLLRRTLCHLLGDLGNITSAHIEGLQELLTKPAGKSLALPRGLSATMVYGECIIGPRGALAKALPSLNGQRRLKVPGETLLSGWRVITKIADREAGKTEAHGWRAQLNFDVVGDKLTVRGRKPGDRFQPLGMAEPKKLQDFLVDAKVPRSWRDRIPLVCSPQHIVWVAGWRIDERAKVCDSTRRVLTLEFKRRQGA